MEGWYRYRKMFYYNCHCYPHPPLALCSSEHAPRTGLSGVRHEVLQKAILAVAPGLSEDILQEQ